MASGVLSGVKRAGARQSAARPWAIGLMMLTISIWLASLAFGFQSGLFVLTLVAFAAAIAGLWRPALGVLGIAALCTLDAVSRMYLLTGGLFRWNTFNYWLVLVMVLNLGWLVRLKSPEIRWLQVFIGVLTAELLFSTDPVGGTQHVLNILILFGLLIYFARADMRSDVWYWAAMVSGTLSGLGSLVFFVQQDALPAVNRNAWSFFPLTSVFAACVCLASPYYRKRSRLLLMLVFLNGGWVFLSGSRGSTLICVVCLVFVLMKVQSMKGAKLTVVAAVLIAIAVGAQFGGLESQAVFRMTKLFDSAESMSARTSHRWDLAMGGWKIFQDHPLGVGTGGFPQAWASLQQGRRILAIENVEGQAHSGWIKVLSENGVPGIVSFVGFVVSFAIVGWQRRRMKMFLPGLLVTIVLGVAFLADEFQGKGLWYLSSAVILFNGVARQGERRGRAAGRNTARRSFAVKAVS